MPYITIIIALIRDYKKRSMYQLQSSETAFFDKKITNRKINKIIGDILGIFWTAQPSKRVKIFSLWIFVSTDSYYNTKKR